MRSQGSQLICKIITSTRPTQLSGRGWIFFSNQLPDRVYMYPTVYFILLEQGAHWFSASIFLSLVPSCIWILGFSFEHGCSSRNGLTSDAGLVEVRHPLSCTYSPGCVVDVRLGFNQRVSYSFAFPRHPVTLVHDYRCRHGYGQCATASAGLLWPVF
jgi:hypothetical protein